MSKNNTRYARINGLCDHNHFATKRVAIIGLGSMGHPVANQLARHGVGTRAPGQLALADGDVVEHRNLIGTEYTESHVGMPKAQAAADMIARINPEVNVSFRPDHVAVADIPQLAEVASCTDLLCLFADSFDVMMRIDAACSNLCPQIMAVFGPHADYAEIAFSIPGHTPPLSRLLGQRKRRSIKSPTAYGCDTMYVASFVAAVCLELLSKPRDHGKLVDCYANAPLFVMGLRRKWLFENEPDDIARSVARVRVSN